jgi:hypothetical protein
MVHEDKTTKIVIIQCTVPSKVRKPPLSPSLDAESLWKINRFPWLQFPRHIGRRGCTHLSSRYRERKKDTNLENKMMREFRGRFIYLFVMLMYAKPRTIPKLNLTLFSYLPNCKARYSSTAATYFYLWCVASLWRNGKRSCNVCRSERCWLA